MNSLNINKYINDNILKFNSSNSIYNKKKLIDNINNIPYKDKNKHILNCLLTILSNNTFSIQDRYNTVFDNRNNYSSDIIYELHLFYFHNFNPPLYPVRYKLNSAQYLINNRNSTTDIRDIQSYLIYLSRLVSTDMSIKTECLDILKRSGLISEVDFNILLNNINNNNYIPQNNNQINDKTQSIKTRIIRVKKNIYNDSQNVHTTSINESVKDIVRKISEENGECINKLNRTNNLSDFSKRLTVLSNTLNIIERQKILGTFDRILIDTSKFERDLSLTDILILVWCKIRTSKDKDELEKRMLEEFIEMNGLCATGHLSRLINILSGFFEYSIKISVNDQIKNYIYNHYNKLIENETEGEKLLDQLVDEKIENKSDILKYIENNNIKEKLNYEFVKTKMIDEIEFESVYDRTIKSYCGIK